MYRKLKLLIVFLFGLSAGLMAIVLLYLLKTDLDTSGYAVSEQKMETNKNAPVYYSGKIIINSSADNVWKVLSGIDNWPKWQKAIEYAKLNGELTPGTTFDWKNGSSKIHSTLQTVKAPNYIGWTGRSMGINAIHNWKITTLENGTTEVFVEESMDGLLAKLMKNYLNKIVKQTLQKSLEELKMASEQKI